MSRRQSGRPSHSISAEEVETLSGVIPEHWLRHRMGRCRDDSFRPVSTRDDDAYPAEAVVAALEQVDDVVCDLAVA